MTTPERIWINLDAPWDGTINDRHGTGGLPEYVRRDPAVLAELPEVREAIAEALLAAHKEIRGMDTEKDEDLNYNLAILRCAEKLRTRAVAIREGRDG